MRADIALFTQMEVIFPSLAIFSVFKNKLQLFMLSSLISFQNSHLAAPVVVTLRCQRLVLMIDKSSCAYQHYFILRNCPHSDKTFQSQCTEMYHDEQDYKDRY